MHESVRLGRIAGVAVGFNWSLLVVFWLLAWSLAAVELPAADPGQPRAMYWLAAIVTAVAFFASLLAHELGHAVVARNLGMEVEGITLWLFGGIARLGGEAATPRAELRVGAIGPAISVAAGVAFGLAALGMEGLGASALLVAVPAWLARINLILAAFNLVPAYPLDGGRVLRAALWAHHGDRLRATVTAARAGRTFAYVLIAVGLIDFAIGAAAGGLWFVFLGWFLLTAARSEETSVVTRELLGDLRVADVMSPDPVVAPAAVTAAEFLDTYALRHRFSAFPIVDGTGDVIGLLTLARLKGVPPGRREVVSAASLSCPLAEVPVARPDEAVVDLLERMATSADGRALVFDHGRLVGIVSPTDVARMLQVATLRAPAHTAETRT